tara:strand:+ start:1563 stop:2492 length:930 start_codon:yes stop_codon:yes gene_type:complete
MAKASAAKIELTKKIWDTIESEINEPFIKNEEPLTNSELFNLSDEDRHKRLDEIQAKRNEFWASTIDDFWTNNNYHRRSSYSNYPSWMDFFSYNDRYGKGYDELPLKDLFDNMKEMLSSTLTKSQLHLLGCFISLIGPLMEQARKTATAEVVADNKHQKERCHKYQQAVEEMYEKMPLNPGAPTSAGVAIANGDKEHLPQEDIMALIKPVLAIDDNGHMPTYTHGDYMLLHKQQEKYKDLFKSAKRELTGGKQLAESLQNYIDQTSQTNAEIEQQVNEINDFLNQPQHLDPAGKANAPQENNKQASQLT